jgi:hypothetical protein
MNGVLNDEGHEPPFPEPVTRSPILFCQSEDGTNRIGVRPDEGTVRLTRVLNASRPTVPQQPNWNENSQCFIKKNAL